MHAVADVVEWFGWTGGSRHMQVHEHLPLWCSTETALAIATATALCLSTFVTIASLATLTHYTFHMTKLVIGKWLMVYNDEKTA